MHYIFLHLIQSFPLSIIVSQCAWSRFGWGRFQKKIAMEDLEMQMSTWTISLMMIFFDSNRAFAWSSSKHLCQHFKIMTFGHAQPMFWEGKGMLNIGNGKKLKLRNLTITACLHACLHACVHARVIKTVDYLYHDQVRISKLKTLTNWKKFKNWKQSKEFSKKKFKI